MKIKVYVASAFSKNGKGGNKAGVVINENLLNVDQKKEISAKLGFAETAFITKSKVADYKINYYTPKEEVDLCGHATVASFVILKMLNLVENKIYSIETKNDVLTVDLTNADTVMMQQSKPQFYETLFIDEVKECFDIDCILDDMPIQIVSTGLKDILVPIKNNDMLLKLNPNFDKIIDISSKYDTVGIHAFTLDTISEEASALCRNFAPLYDVYEEAATGTSNCALACYLSQKEYIVNDEYIFEQGYNFEYPSEIFAKLIKSNGEIERAFVGGCGYFCNTIDLEI